MTSNLPANLPPAERRLPADVRLAIILGREPGEGAVHWVGRLMEMLPPPTEDVVDKITEALLASEGPADENAFWDEGTTATRNAINRRFIFRSVHALPSDQPDSALPFYLICRVTDPSTGEELLLNTGSVSIVTALVKAQLLGGLPWEAEIVGPRRQTRNKRTPLHLRWIAKVVEPDQDQDQDQGES